MPIPSESTTGHALHRAARTPVLAVLIAASAAVLVAGCSSDAGQPQGSSAPLLVNGTVQAYDAAAIVQAQASGSTACTTSGAWAGAHKGAQVQVFDTSNKAVATGTLSDGAVGGTEIKGNPPYCGFTWHASVPLGSQSFSLVLAGETTVQTPAELQGGPIIIFGPH